MRALVAEGVLEVTLLGQNVNSYGVEFGDRYAFGKLLRACGDIDGLERVRFTSPHPKDFTDDVIAAMAETPNVCHSLHMPLQSGSDDVLKAMRRSYRSERYLGIIDKVRAAMPDAAITTDIIVGFPGETEADFQRTLDVVRAGPVLLGLHLPVLEAPRHPGRDHGRPAAQAGRAGALRAADRHASRRSPGRRTSAWSGETVEVLVAVGEGRKDERTGRLSGRARDGRLVHFDAGELRRVDPARATSCTPRSRTPPRTTSTPTARRCRTAAPGPATRPRPAAPRVPPGCCSACPRSARRRSRPRRRPAAPRTDPAGARRHGGPRPAAVRP